MKPDLDTTRAAVVRYFEETIPFYRRFWHGDTDALHFGLRGDDTRGHRDELIRTNAVLAEAAAVRPGDVVLDAGCGVGGSALWLARERGARVIGVTLSPSQARLATDSACAAGLGDRVSFRVDDYTRTGLADSDVDVVWALESACYAPAPGAFLAEAARVLRPGGRLVVADGFLARRPRARERGLYRAFLDGLALARLATVEEFVASLRDVGLVPTRVESRLAEVAPSARRLFGRCLASYPLAVLARSLGLVSDAMLANSRAGIALHLLVRRRVVDYALIGAVKPAGAGDG
jgi:SAM-dependent methyltransferase